MNKVKNIFVVFSILALLGCAAVPVSKPLDPQRAVIGISVKIRPPTKILAGQSDEVYIVKVEEEEDLYNQGFFTLSNYVKGSQVYLLNAKPGRYAAVASSFTRMRGKYMTFFPKKLIKLTEVTVAPGTIAFMGEYVVDTSTGLEDADDAQLHYAGSIAPGAEKTGYLSMAFGGKTYYKGSLHEEKRDKQAEIKFLTNALEHFKDTGWINIIQKRTEELKAEK